MTYFLLFVVGFIAATLLPASSEALMLASYFNGASIAGLWLAATAGNTLGSCVNWWLGKELLRFQHKRWFPATPQQLARGERHFQKYGQWGLLFAWLPVVGDPFTLVAGILGTPFPRFLILVGVGKAARYALVLYLASFFAAQ